MPPPVIVPACLFLPLYKGSERGLYLPSWIEDPCIFFGFRQQITACRRQNKAGRVAAIPLPQPARHLHARAIDVA